MIGRRLRSAPVLAGIGLFGGSLALYLSTLAPTLTWGWNDFGVDGGELLAAAKTLGVPHPPGYPTYTLLLKLFATAVPLGDYAFRGNLLSALLASGSVAAVYWAAHRICVFLRPDAPRGLATVGAALGGAVFATSPLFWSQAVITEVYTLNALFAGALLVLASHLALPPIRGKPGAPAANRGLLAFGLLLGAGLGNHLTLLAVAAPLLYWLGSSMGWRKALWPWMIGGLVIGLAVYAYLPIGAARDAPVNWGNADTLQGVVWMLTARPYQEYVFGVAAGTILNRLLSWTELTFVQFNPLGIFLGLMAAGSLRSAAPRFFYPILGSILLISVYSVTYNTTDFEVLMIPAFLIFAVWVGVGFFWIVATSIRDFAPGSGALSKWRGRVTALHQAAVLSVLAFALLPAASIVLNYASQDRSADRTAWDHAAAIMAAAPDGSVVFSHSEKDVFSLWYMRYVEQPDRDVAVIAEPLLQFDWYLADIHRMFPERVPEMSAMDIGEAMRRIVRHNDGRAAVFATYRPLALTDTFDLERVDGVYVVRAR